MKPNLFDIISMEENDLFIFSEKFLGKFYDKLISNRFEYLYGVGKNKICLVAHLDSLADYKNMALCRNHRLIYNRNGILGADDRAGVYAIFKVLSICIERKIPLPSVILTTGEEAFGVGAKSFCETIPSVDKINLFIELDRRGANQYVYYMPSLPTQVHKWVRQWGYVENVGSFTDISILCSKYLIPGVNLSVGYYCEHQSAEVLHVDELFLTISRLEGMLRNPVPRLYRLKDERSPSPKKNYKNRSQKNSAKNRNHISAGEKQRNRESIGLLD